METTSRKNVMFRTDLMDQSPNRRKVTVLLAGFNDVKQEVVFIIEYIKYFKNNELKRFVDYFHRG
jgi:hypothetical protein